MKAQKLYIVVLAAIFTCIGFTAVAQPNWTVNPYLYDYSMTITGRVNIEGTTSVDVNDKVAAFIGEECRGVVNVKYQSTLQDYFVFLMIYSNSTSGLVSFKIYDASENKEIKVGSPINFAVNGIVGSVSIPFIFSDITEIFEAKILSFSIPDQEGKTIIDGTTIKLKRSSNKTLTEIAADFSISQGATAFVNGKEQESNVTINNYSSPVEFMIVSASYSDTSIYIVNISLVTNNPPTAIYLSNIFVRELSKSNTLVGTLNVEDKDIFDTYNFSLAPGDGFTDSENSFFGIVGNNLLLMKPVDYEKKQLLNIIISVTDAGENTYKESFRLEVIDENDPPTTIHLSTNNIKETAELNSIVAILSAEDADLVDSHYFRLIDGNGSNDAQNGFFRIENEKLILVKPLSFEENPVLNILVSVTDKDSAYLQEEIVLNVTNENDPPTAIKLSNTSIIESTELFTTVSVIKAVDKDLFDSHQFSLIAGNGENDSGNAFFTIVGDKLVLTQSLNFEDKQNLNVLIRATDKSGAYIEETLVINITDANDPPTAINLSNKIVSESTELNAIVATLEAEDVDSLDSHNFSLIAGNGSNDAQNKFFKIDDDNLILVQPLNFVNNQLLNILIRVTDEKGAFFDKSFVLQVTNENNPPKFTSIPLNYIFQNEVFVYPIVVTDADFDPIELSFENLPDWLIYNSNSKIITGEPGNKEVGDYNFKIMASDGQIESVQIVAFTVINVNEPPVIKQFPGTQFFLIGRENKITLPENLIIDPDKGDKLTYQLSTENNSAIPYWLIFDPEQLTITGNPPENENGVYNLKLVATDKSGLKEYVVFKLEVSFPTSIADQNMCSLFKVFPNPVKNNLYIDIPDGKDNAKVSITNMSGQLIKIWELYTGHGNMVSLNGFEPGIYFVRLQQGELVQTKKIIKE